MQNELYYTRPGKYWMECLPLGNGSMGAMCAGEAEVERIVLNHDTLWTGRPGKAEKPGAYAAWKQAQTMVRAGEYRQAQALLEADFLTCWSQAYLTFGELVLDFGKQEFTDYRRSLSLARAAVTSSFRTGEGCVKKTAFVSFPHRVFVYRVESEQPLRFTLGVRCPLKSTVSVRDATLLVDGECPGDGDTRSPHYPCHSLIYSEDARGVQFRGGVRVLTDGTVHAEGDRLRVENSRCATVYVSICTSYNGFDKDPVTQGREYRQRCLADLEAACAAGYAAVLAAHEKDHAALYDRVQLRLGSGGEEALPTDLRLKRHARGHRDPGLHGLLFNYGRYLLIASSRPGSMATNLQAIWNNSVKPEWNSNYTVNINTQMNYWPALPCALPELMQPLEGLVGMLAQSGRDTAREFYGASGFVCHHNTDIWGFSTPVWGSAVYGCWPGGSGWLCRGLYEKFLYTRDEDYLRNTALPLMRQAAQFYLDIMEQDEKGHWIVTPATSPENAFVMEGEPAAVCRSTAMLNAIAADVLHGCREAYRILGLRDDFSDRVNAVLPHIKPAQIGCDGRILEWDEPLEEFNPEHRHMSHLYGVYPARAYTPEQPEYMEATRKVLEVKGDEGCGWSFAWKCVLWAILGQGDRAVHMVDQLLRPVEADCSEGAFYDGGGGSYPNLLGAHPFQIDGNMGIVAGMAEMLVQSDEKTVKLLPALPALWSEGEVRGLAVRGGCRVDIRWKDGKVTDYAIHGNPDGMRVVCCR